MKSLLAAIVVLTCMNLCFAEDFETRGNVFGSFGVTAVHDDESYLGSGLDIGGGIGYLITPRLELELEVDSVNFERDFSSGVHFEGDAFTTSGALKIYFESGRIRPYILGGITNVHFHQQNFIDVLFESKGDSFGFQAGGGVRIFLAPRLSISPEFRWTITEFSFINQLRGSVGVAYHW